MMHQRCRDGVATMLFLISNQEGYLPAVCPHSVNEAMVSVMSRLHVGVLVALMAGGTAGKTKTIFQARPMSKVLDLMCDMFAKGEVVPPRDHERKIGTPT